MKTFASTLLFLLTISSAISQTPATTLYETEDLIIRQIGPKSYVHVSYIQLPNMGGTFPCNGLIYVSEQEAMVFDTPLSDSVSGALIDWIEDSLQANITGVVINHFHTDCLGGLGEFHRRGIPSYANALTVELARNKPVVPQQSFRDSLKLTVGSQEVINRYFGKGHTADNIVSYIPAENLLFGGCMIKEVDASKGNLEDADVAAWPRTVQKIKNSYPNLQTIVPGHGQTGGTELLDYTIKLFGAGQ